MHPSFEQFVAALRDPSQRPAIGLVIGDADAASLLTNQDWAMDYFHKWLALFPAATAATQPTAAFAAPEPAPVLTPAPQAAPESVRTPAPAISSAPAVSNVPEASAPATPRGSRVPLLVVGTVLGAVVLAVLAVLGLTALTDSLHL